MHKSAILSKRGERLGTAHNHVLWVFCEISYKLPSWNSCGLLPQDHVLCMTRNEAYRLKRERPIPAHLLETKQKFPPRNEILSAKCGIVPYELLVMSPQTPLPPVQAIAIALGSPPQLDKTLPMKKSTHLVALHRKISLN